MVKSTFSDAFMGSTPHPFSASPHAPTPALQEAPEAVCPGNAAGSAEPLGNRQIFRPTSWIAQSSYWVI